METVEYLMIGKETFLQLIVSKSLMKGFIDMFKTDVVSPFLKYILQTFRLFFAIGTYI